MAKPLLSPLLLENANATLPTGFSTVPTPAPVLGAPARASSMAMVTWSTPKKAQDLNDQLGLLTRLNEGSTTQRVLFRKVEKGWDNKDIDIADARKKIQNLEMKLEESRPKRRKRVYTNPNSKFVNIEAVKKAQLSAERIEINFSGSDEAELSSGIEDGIIVGIPRR